MTDTSDMADAREPVVISGQAFLDLTHLTPEQMAGIDRIEGIATVLLRESQSAAYAAISVSGVASTLYVPDGNLRFHRGMLSVAGDGLGAEDDVVIVQGMLIITSTVTRPVPKRIHVDGLVIAPRDSGAMLSPLLAGSGNVTFYPGAEAPEIKVITGQMRLSGAMLANLAGQPEDILIIAGQVLVTGVPPAVGYRSLVIAGQVALPASGRDVLEPKLEVLGQIGWYAGDDPRVFFESTTLGPDFFRLLDHPVGLVTFEKLTFAEGVSEETLLGKVGGIVAYEKIVAPPELIGAVQVLATDVFESIQASGGPGN
jgi:hypothetical protein